MLKDEKIDYTSLGMTLFCLCTDGRTLKTCALRPAGIYGEGELRHLPRIVVCSLFCFISRSRDQ